MTTLVLKAQHETSVIGQLLDLKASVLYHEKSIAPHYYQMEKWEQKEYSAVYSANVEKLTKLKGYIVSNESLFNDLLAVYNISVAVFVNKYLLN